MSKKSKVPEVVYVPMKSDRRMYFDNNKVEDLMVKYHWTACTDIQLRDEIMSHSEELIRQVIRAHGLNRIYIGGEESSFGDLFQTAWVQIERTLYKYKADPHCYDCSRQQKPCKIRKEDYDPYEIIKPEEIVEHDLHCPTCGTIPERITYKGASKVFNMWSQVARTVALAYIKKEGRDYKNSDSYKSFLGDSGRLNHHSRFKDHKKMIDKFIKELRDVFEHNPSYDRIIDALEKIAKEDADPHRGIITRLVEVSDESRTQVTNFLRELRLRQFEFSDSPAARSN